VERCWRRKGGEEEEEEEESLFKADAVNEEDSERDRATREEEGGGDYSYNSMRLQMALLQAGGNAGWEGGERGLGVSPKRRLRACICLQVS